MIAAFAAAVGATDPVHTDAEAARAAGYRDVIAPPTLAVRFDQLASREYVLDPEAGIDYSRVVHGEQVRPSPPDHRRRRTHRPEHRGRDPQRRGHAMITVRSEITAGDEAGRDDDLDDRRPGGE